MTKMMEERKEAKEVDYYECRCCGYRIPEIVFIRARFAYPCAGRNPKRKCDQTIDEYKVVYKEKPNND